MRKLVACVVALAVAGVANAAPIYATSLVTQSNTTSFGSGLVTGAPDGGGRWLGSTSDPPAQLGSLTVAFATPLGNGAGADLVVVDVGSSSNETASVEVSSNGVTFTLIGSINAVANSIDFGTFTGPVSFVRLTNTSTQVSMDVDAVYGNYEFQAAAVPEPVSMVVFGSLVVGGIVAVRRRMTKAAA